MSKNLGKKIKHKTIVLENKNKIRKKIPDPVLKKSQHKITKNLFFVLNKEEKTREKRNWCVLFHE